MHEIKAQLNRHAEILATEYGSTGLTVHDVIWDTPNIDYEIPSNLTNIFNNVKLDSISETSLSEDSNNLTFYKIVIMIFLEIRFSLICMSPKSKTHYKSN